MKPTTEKEIKEQLAFEESKRRVCYNAQSTVNGGGYCIKKKETLLDLLNHKSIDGRNVTTEELEELFSIYKKEFIYCKKEQEKKKKAAAAKKDKGINPVPEKEIGKSKKKAEWWKIPRVQPFEPQPVPEEAMPRPPRFTWNPERGLREDRPPHLTIEEAVQEIERQAREARETAAQPPTPVPAQEEPIIDMRI